MESCISHLFYPQQAQRDDSLTPVSKFPFYTHTDKTANWFTKQKALPLNPNCRESNSLAHKGLTPNIHCSDSVGHVAYFRYLKCPNHAPERLKAKVPMSPYSFIIISIFHCKVVNKTGKPECNQQGKKEAEGKRQKRRDEAKERGSM